MCLCVYDDDQHQEREFAEESFRAKLFSFPSTVVKISRIQCRFISVNFHY